MSNRTDSRFADYLKNAPEFARPILEHIRGLVHDVCPTVQETVKWRMPTFVHRGKILCLVGAFKAHCRLHFWNSEVVLRGAGEPFEHLTRVADLPDDRTLRRFLEAAVENAESGEAAALRPPAPKRAKPELPVPADLADLLKKVPAARKTLKELPPGCRREYLAWIADAKREETRVRRMATAVAWLAEGKRFAWKYQ